MFIYFDVSCDEVVKLGIEVSSIVSLLSAKKLCTIATKPINLLSSPCGLITCEIRFSASRRAMKRTACRPNGNSSDGESGEGPQFIHEFKELKQK